MNEKKTHLRAFLTVHTKPITTTIEIGMSRTMETYEIGVSCTMETNTRAFSNTASEEAWGSQVERFMMKNFKRMLMNGVIQPYGQLVC